jgi:predicted ferric reductase
LLVAIVLLSSGVVKKHLNYELWFRIHVLAYVAIALAFAHQLKTGSDLMDSPALLNLWYCLYAFAFGNLLVFHLFKPLILFWRHGFRVEKIVPESDTVVSVYIRGKNMDKFRFEPGLFIIVRFLAKGFRMEAHPFSLSSSAAGGHIRISIKNSGDFTSRVPRLPEGTMVIIEGPLGVFTPASCTHDRILLIAAGIGITPLISLAEKFLQEEKKVALLYSTRERGGIAFKKELEALKAYENLSLSYIISDNPSTDEEKGRIDGEKIKRLIPDVTERDVYLCGPVPMMQGTIKILSSLGVKKNAIHFERFSL